MRPRCSAYLATSLDGFIARTDGSLDWLEAVQVAGEDYGYAEFFASVDTLVVGRRTYEAVAGFPSWPWSGKRVVVLSHRPLDARNGETRADGPLGALLEGLHAEGARHAYVDGGEVVRQFLAAGLLDRLTLSVVPVLLGEGRPLFGGVARALTLASTRAFPSGLVQLGYELG